EPPPEAYTVHAPETVPTVSSTAIQAQPILADAPRHLPARESSPASEPAAASPRLPELPGVTRPIELWLYEREQTPPPRWPFLSGVFTFPAYPTVLRSWAYLSILALMWGWLVKFLLSSMFF